MSTWTQALVVLALVALTLLVFWPVMECGFVNVDDPDYVTENPQVQLGLTRESVAWAFTTREAANWHPLTWLSLMLDYDCYGLEPAGYHRTNLLLHAVNVAILFLLLNTMTGALARSALVAALFAVHPLRVESVAWVSERKDVLCALFGLLAIAAYVRYARSPGVLRYSLVLVLFVLSLTAKPMLVTLPFLLLLLDFWPLGRLKPAEATPTEKPEAKAPRLFAREKLMPLLLEKLPLLAVAVASSLVTFIVQRSLGVQTLDAYPLVLRFANVLISYVRYPGKMLRFDNLAVFYPYPAWPLWQVVACASFLIAAVWAVLWRLRANPWLAVGWFWYLGLLVPVIGLVQVGSQSMADRYTYLPTIGLLILFAWSLPERLFRTLGGRVLLAIAVAGLLVAFSFYTRTQIGYWRDSRTLFEHALAVTENNHLAHNGLGVVLFTEGRPADALEHFQTARNISPSDANNSNLGSALRAVGRLPEAVDAYTQAIEIQPELAVAYYGRAAAYDGQGKFQLAIADYDRAIELKPRWADAFAKRGNALVQLGQPQAALRDFNEAIRLNPSFLTALNLRAWLLATCPDPSVRDGNQAVNDATRACELTSWHESEPLDTLAAAWAERGDFQAAARWGKKALEQVGGNEALAREFRTHLELYKSGKPVRDQPASKPATANPAGKNH